MPTHETYVLHLYRSRSVSGWQWAARLDHLTDGESHRFNDPEVLLAHLQAMVRRPGRPEMPADSPGEVARPVTSTEGGIPQEGQPDADGTQPATPAS